MTFVRIPSGAATFLDANTLVYHFTSDPKYGSPCTQLIKRVELGDVRGFTSAHVLGLGFSRLNPALGRTSHVRAHPRKSPR
jgi:hypothetical protein